MMEELQSFKDGHNHVVLCNPFEITLVHNLFDNQNPERNPELCKLFQANQQTPLTRHESDSFPPFQLSFFFFLEYLQIKCEM